MRNVREDAHKKVNAFLVAEPLRSGRTPPPDIPGPFQDFFIHFSFDDKKNLKSLGGGVVNDLYRTNFFVFQIYPFQVFLASKTNNIFICTCKKKLHKIECPLRG